MIWIELEARTTNFRVRTFRGQAVRSEIDSLVSGEDTGFLRLVDCYWYNDPDDEEEAGKTLGTYDRLGFNQYSNFTGEILLRRSTILNISFLKSGIEGEPGPRKV